MISDPKVSKAVKELIAAMKETDTYREYEACRKKVMSDPELSRSIKRTRIIREQLNKMSDSERNSASAEALENEYDELCDITGVHKFSLAELEVCEMYQNIMAEVVSNVDINL